MSPPVDRAWSHHPRPMDPREHHWQPVSVLACANYYELNYSQFQPIIDKLTDAIFRSLCPPPPQHICIALCENETRVGYDVGKWLITASDSRVTQRYQAVICRQVSVEGRGGRETRVSDCYVATSVNLFFQRRSAPVVNCRTPMRQHWRAKTVHMQKSVEEISTFSIWSSSK